MNKLCAAAVLVVMVLASLSVPLAAAAEATDGSPGRCPVDAPLTDFIDRRNYWDDIAGRGVGKTHARNIDCVVGLGVAVGKNDEYFGSVEKVTRAQMATFIIRSLEAAGYDVPTKVPSVFSDTAGTSHRRNIDRLLYLRIVRGTGPRTYDPYGTTTKAQMATFMVQAHAWASGQDPRTWGPKVHHFADVEPGSTHAANINRAVELGLISGRVDGSNYEPYRFTSRAQMATYTVNLMDSVWNH